MSDTQNRDHHWTPPRSFDVEKAMPWIREYRRDAVRLHPRRADRELARNASKMGGMFLWPAEEPWPFCVEADPISMPRPTREDFRKSTEALMAMESELGIPPRAAEDNEFATRMFEGAAAAARGITDQHNIAYSPILQLRRDEFPELPWPAGKDLFQLLWCPRVHFWGNSSYLGGQSSGAKIFWRTEESIHNFLTPWESNSHFHSLHECAVNPEDIFEYPQACYFDSAIEAWLEHAHTELKLAEDSKAGLSWWYSYDIATAPGTKLLGHPQWIQNEETPMCRCNKPMKLLLTCASQEDPDNKAWNIAPCRESIKTPGTLDQSRNPFGFSWGDWSNAYVFYCDVGHPLEFRTVVQSS